MEQFKRGDLVVLRTYGDVAETRRVWSDEGATVLVCDDDQFGRKCKDEALPLLPYPSEFVYAFEPGLEERINSGQVKWDELTPKTGGYLS